jgi:hypothetical protein
MRIFRHLGVDFLGDCFGGCSRDGVDGTEGAGEEVDAAEGATMRIAAEARGGTNEVISLSLIDLY